MWWKKEIDDHCTLVIMRIFISIVYMFVSTYLCFNSDAVYTDHQNLKEFSIFFLMLAFTTLFPTVESMYSKESKRFVNMLSITLSFFIIIIMHVYLFNSFGMAQTYDYIGSSFWLNVVIQLPILYLVNKVYEKKF